MNFAFSDEQEALRSTVRQFLADTSPEAEVRRLMETTEGFSPEAWQRLAGQLGLLGLIVPEAYGGAGSTFLELVVVFEEMGRSLLCAPFFSTVAMATTLLLALDDDAARKRPAAADRRRELRWRRSRWPKRAGSWQVRMMLHDDRHLQAGPGWTLSGEKRYVLDGHVADVVLVVARTLAGIVCLRG